MKTIVISGACSHIGKTTVAKSICEILPGAVFVKIGTGQKKESLTDLIYPFGTRFDEIRAKYPDSGFLIIESNHILTELSPDLCIYLDGQPEKPSAKPAKEKADLHRGQKVEESILKDLSTRLEISIDKMKEICFLAGAHPEPLSAIILAGGDSSRMGKNKAFLPFNDKPLIRHIYDFLSPIFDEVIISAASISKDTDFTIPNAPIAIDPASGQGPLMGIYSGLCLSSHMVNFVIACDIPKIDYGLLRKLLSYSLHYDIVVPSFKAGKYEPLIGVYTKRVTPLAKTLLDQNKRQVICLFPLCKTKIIETSNMEWYLNLNTPQDYEDFVAKNRKLPITKDEGIGN